MDYMAAVSAVFGVVLFIVIMALHVADYILDPVFQAFDRQERTPRWEEIHQQYKENSRIAASLLMAGLPAAGIYRLSGALGRDRH